MRRLKVQDVVDFLEMELMANPDGKVVNISASNARTLVRFVRQEMMAREETDEIKELETKRRKKERAVLVAETKRREAEARLNKLIEDHNEIIRKMRIKEKKVKHDE